MINNYLYNLLHFVTGGGGVMFGILMVSSILCTLDTWESVSQIALGKVAFSKLVWVHSISAF